MWYSIKSIIKPDTLAEAYSLQQGERTTLFSGGSYLVAENNKSIQTLIDINGVISDKVTVNKKNVNIDAGATLQSFIDSVKHTKPNCRLLDGAKNSCPSKNIRNQRTFGGEVGQNRPNSEILVFLHAVDAALTVFTNSEKTISIRKWDGKGIVTKITYYPKQIDSIELQRYSVLPSAPAIVIVGGTRRSGQLEFAIGGTANNIQTFVVRIDDETNNSIANIAQKAISQFIPDHFGSLNYKESLIATAVKRVVDAL
ncbi:MAG: FAD binding domain-containing protein [Candidatus Marinimicrobia bacterium]|nr:FAD binding domain-containing protein [Candidatus Neomarinimicrobiota bacterium]